MKVKQLTAVMALSLGFVGLAQAVPVQLPTDAIAKMKFTNYENFRDVGNVSYQGTQLSTPGDGFINAGDKFYGILDLTSIGTIADSNLLSAQLANKEVTGYFQITVQDGAIPFIPGSSGHVDFYLDAAAGDRFDFYVEDNPTAATMWDPASAAGVADAIARATNGTLWAQVNAGGFVEGLNDSYNVPTVDSLSQFWTDLTTNNTGYIFTSQLWPEVFSGAGTGAHVRTPPFSPTSPTNTGDMSQIYQTSHLTFTSSGDPASVNWQIRSEDPVYASVTVPEPATIALLGLGLLGIGGLRRRAV